MKPNPIRITSMMRFILVATFLASSATGQTDPQVDWRTKGMVTPVKNMGQCGADYAFAATGAIEGAFALVKGLHSLSEQQILDCSSDGNQGCNGGTVEGALKFVMRNHGIGSEAGYQFTARDGACRAALPVATIVGYQVISNTALIPAVNQRPIAALIHTTPAYYSYRSGILPCVAGTANHWVTIVGYGNDAASKKDYWLVKESLGTSWGDKGYVKLERSPACNAVGTAYSVNVQ